jgi:hypothetical protein
VKPPSFFATIVSVVASGGCSSQVGVTDTDCPNYLVTPDGGVSGFYAVGEWRTDAVCNQYWEPDFPVCQLQTPTTVKCQKGCG